MLLGFFFSDDDQLSVGHHTTEGHQRGEHFSPSYSPNTDLSIWHAELWSCKNY